MTVWTRLVEDSGILERLSELGPAIDDARARNDNTPEDIEGLERIRAVLAFVGERLDAADSNLLSATLLARVAAAAAESTAHVRLFVGGGEQVHLTNANASVDGLLLLFADVMLPANPNDFRGLRKAADSYREAMTQQLLAFDADAERTRKQGVELTTLLSVARQDFESAKTTLGEELEAFKGEITVAQNELKGAQQAAKTQFEEEGTAAFTQWAADFAAAETARKEAHESSSAETVAAFRKIVTGYDDELKAKSEAAASQIKAALTNHEIELKALQESYVVRADVVLQTIEANLGRVQELVGVIGDHGVTGGFKTAADDALKQVKYFQRVTLGSMLLLVGFTGFTALTVHGAAVNWLDLGRRLLFTVTVGALATYAASQTNRYQLAERKNRKLELELRALGPFLEPVAPEEREKFRLKIAEVFFGKDEPAHPERPSPATALHASKETFDKLLDVAKAIVERK
jgi:uncharacterized protein YeaO (DUF488 family)